MTSLSLLFIYVFFFSVSIIEHTTWPLASSVRVQSLRGKEDSWWAYVHSHGSVNNVTMAGMYVNP